MFLVQQQVLALFILLLHQAPPWQRQQQFFCHASWANGTTTDATATTNKTTRIIAGQSNLTPQPSASAPPSLALSLGALTSTSMPPLPPQPPHSRHRTQILSVYANCTRELLEMHITLNGEFRGLLYAKDFPLECRARGNSATNVTLRVPTSGCGVRAEPLADGSMEYSVRVMLQMEQKLRQSTDILRTVRCVLPARAMGMQVRVRLGEKLSNVEQPNAVRNARMRKLNVAAAAEAAATTATLSDNMLPTTTMPNSTQHQAQHVVDTPRVRIWLELGGPNGSGSVEVGVATTLTVRAIVPGNIGVRVVDCSALDGLGDATQQLLDARGCPIDEQVMPALHTRFRPAEEGWSKQLDEDLVEKTFTATFPAFKFPDRERLHVSCGVQLCKGKCLNLNCRTGDQLNLAADNNLARIEVFNSLAVTAPQIEVDRLRYDRRYNMSGVDEYGPNIRALPSEGTLCLSISKLAISFCVLGLIFLIAVIVAIWSLIRTRRRLGRNSCTGSGSNSSSRLQRAELCTSMFSSSSESAQSARFGSKLFIPYYPHTLPYGRVY